MSHRTVVLLVLTPLFAFAGLVAGFFVTMTLGLNLHGNYMYYLPDQGLTTPSLIGGALYAVGAILGAVIPWVTSRLLFQAPATRGHGHRSA